MLINFVIWVVRAFLKFAWLVVLYPRLINFAVWVVRAFPNFAPLVAFAWLDARGYDLAKIDIVKSKGCDYIYHSLEDPRLINFGVWVVRAFPKFAWLVAFAWLDARGHDLAKIDKVSVRLRDQSGL